ncbi:integral membrane protein [Rhizodiscina lignyota]|uniref:Integral membrane protein n=1 Tax=Rhizodiscina lignyota TaxID=1504668 RepID=A0A9P4M987_9PEZI|nr:integral membrane protein [Rhizodiscina lignyota]
MSRGTKFRPEREPLSSNQALRLHSASGPFSFLNPTRAHYNHVGSALHELKDGEEPPPPAYEQHATQPAADIGFSWTSRNNRKGRHQLLIEPATAASEATYACPESTNTIKHMLRVMWRMVTYYPVWDISWLVAYVFTWGSIIWVINGFFAFLPEVDEYSVFKNETLYGGGITAFIGATVFEIGSFLLMLEAVNENRTGCFGWAIRKLYEQNNRSEKTQQQLDHMQNEAPESPQEDAGKAWVWFPSWQDLKSHYLHELGFLACLSQLCGATIFWIAGFTALPGIFNKMSPGLTDGVYWAPQVIGGTGFIISGTLFMIETQKKWYLPAVDVLGWHIGLWNLIGGIGFTLSPAFGFDTHYWAQYQAACSTFWGSWAFLLGSLIQLYESLEKNPVEVEPLKKPDASASN